VAKEKRQQRMKNEKENNFKEINKKEKKKCFCA